MAKKKFTVKADKENVPGYDSELEIEVDDGYEAYFKGTIPEPTPYQGFTITWFNNFGVRDKNSKVDTDVEYTVKLKKLPAGKRLFVLQNGKVIEVTQKTPKDSNKDKLKFADAESGKVKFTWDAGDPPTGTGP